jgi:hypothetical protein
MLKTFPASDPFNLHWRAFKLCNQNRIAAALEARNRALCKCDPSPDDHEIGCPMWRLP